MKLEFVPHTVELSVGDKLLFYTDGLTEATPKSQDTFNYEEERLLESLHNHSQKSGTDFLNAVYADLVDFRQGDSFDDDICLVLLSV